MNSRSFARSVRPRGYIASYGRPNLEREARAGSAPLAIALSYPLVHDRHHEKKAPREISGDNISLDDA